MVDMSRHRSTAMMSAPSSASRMAWLRPWPRAAPVMNATLPSTRPMMRFPSVVSGALSRRLDQRAGLQPGTGPALLRLWSVSGTAFITTASHSEAGQSSVGPTKGRGLEPRHPDTEEPLHEGNRNVLRLAKFASGFSDFSAACWPGRTQPVALVFQCCASNAPAWRAPGSNGRHRHLSPPRRAGALFHHRLPAY